MAVEFDTDQNTTTSFQSRRLIGSPVTPRTITWLVKKGIANSEAEAARYLAYLVIACICLSLYLIYRLYTPAATMSPALIEERTKLLNSGPPQ
jgi:hypothetical protein